MFFLKSLEKYAKISQIKAGMFLYIFHKPKENPIKMDTYAEQLVIKENTTLDTLKRVLIIAGSFILAVALFLFFSILGLLPVGAILALGIAVGAYFLILNLGVEYEYIITEGELDVDKIVAKRTRSRLLTIKVEKFTEYGIITDAKEKEGLTVFMTNGRGYSDYYADFTHKTHGECRLIFSPDEKIQSLIEPYLTINKE